MFGSKLGASLDERGLRLVLALFFLALAVPTAVLIWQARSQLKWEAFHQQRLVAEELAARIDARQIELIKEAEAHSFADYRFLVIEGDPSAKFLQRSPLSGFPVEGALPGLVGWFQVDAEGRFSTPLLPTEDIAPQTYGISDDEHQARLALERQIREVLSENRLVKSGPVERDAETPLAMRDEADADKRVMSAPQESTEQEVSASRGATTGAEYFNRAIADQAAFDRYDDGRASDSKDELTYEVQSTASGVASTQRASPPPEAAIPRAKRKEQAVVAEPVQRERLAVAASEAPGPAPVAITTFESEIDPFEFSLLDSGHFVLYRTAWREGQRFIQGAIIEQQSFLADLIGAAFETSALSRTSDLIVGFGAELLNAFGAVGNAWSRNSEQPTGDLLYQTRLSAPLDSLALTFRANQLPAGPGGRVLGWITLILALVFSA
ncbi:MAG TPA: sensor histidine kinase, partial [Gammaproteobacteria bacterium]|nr:sensor histidine kinase [Gammaproteobacteria bacterium]